MELQCINKEHDSPFRNKHSNINASWTPRSQDEFSYNKYPDEINGEISLILYTIVDALYSVQTNKNYSERFDDVLWLTEKEKVIAPRHSLQFFCELIGARFKKVQKAVLSILCDSSLVDQNARVNITYRSYDNSEKGKRCVSWV